MNVEEENSLTVSIEPKYATNKTIAWTSSNPAVVTVELGKVKAIAPGAAKIIAKSANGKVAECEVIVK